MLFVRLFGLCCLDLSVSSSSWGLGRDAVCDCSTPWTFLLPFFFNIPTESREQIAQDRTKWRGLIRRGAGEYEAKRIREAKQKRAQRKARAKASLTELSSSDLSCSIYNRQVRAKIGLISQGGSNEYICQNFCLKIFIFWWQNFQSI